MVDFIKWCFRDEDSGVATVVVIVILSSSIAAIIRAFKNK